MEPTGAGGFGETGTQRCWRHSMLLAPLRWRPYPEGHRGIVAGWRCQRHRPPKFSETSEVMFEADLCEGLELPGR